MCNDEHVHGRRMGYVSHSHCGRLLTIFQIGTFGIKSLNGFNSQSWYVRLYMLAQSPFQQDLCLKSCGRGLELVACSCSRAVTESNTLQYQWCIQNEYLVLITCAKLSALCTYLRVSPGLKLRWFIFVTFGIVASFGIGWFDAAPL
jgi:hypothetical protein